MPTFDKQIMKIMKVIVRSSIPAFLIILLPIQAIAWDTGSFRLVLFNELSGNIKWKIDHYEGKDNVFVFIDRGLIVFDTRKGDEYGYNVDSVVIHDVESGRTYYLYCWDFEREDKTTMRGIEPDYSKFEIVGDGKVKIEIKKKGIINGHVDFDIRRPSFEYTEHNNS